MTLLTDEIKAMIGREVHYPAREELSRASIRHFALALGDANPLFLDDDYARKAGYPSIIAPSTLICDTCQYAHREAEERGYFGHSWDIPLPDCRIIRVGNEYEFYRPILPSDRISVSWRLEDIVEKRSSRGGTQLFVYSLVRFLSSDEELVATNRETGLLQPREPRSS